jgi:hypothetical protein
LLLLVFSTVQVGPGEWRLQGDVQEVAGSPLHVALMSVAGLLLLGWVAALIVSMRGYIRFAWNTALLQLEGPVTSAVIGSSPPMHNGSTACSRHDTNITPHRRVKTNTDIHEKVMRLSNEMVMTLPHNL